MTHSY